MAIAERQPIHPAPLSSEITPKPTVILKSIFDNKTTFNGLLFDGPNKDSILENAKQQINALEPQEKIVFLEELFAILAYDNGYYQDKREATLDVLRVIDLTNINPENLGRSYTETIKCLNKDSDPYGEIDALLEAGKIIAPFIPARQRITLPWKAVASYFTGDDEKRISEGIGEIRKLTHGDLATFDAEVRILAEKRLRNQAIADELDVPLIKVARAIKRLRSRGIKDFKRETGKMPNRITKNT